MTKQNAGDKKAKVRTQTAARQRVFRKKRVEAGYPRREFNLNDRENDAVVALIKKMRA
ncbi:MAG: hypothetical protein V3U84_02220 [Thiotrichaceae bacterium]